MADSERDVLAEALDNLARILEGRGISRNDPHVNRQVNALAALVRAAQPSAELGRLRTELERDIEHVLLRYANRELTQARGIEARDAINAILRAALQPEGSAQG